MIRYDGNVFCMTWKMDMLFEDMENDTELWMREYSILVDCIYVALWRPPQRGLDRDYLPPLLHKLAPRSPS